MGRRLGETSVGANGGPVPGDVVGGDTASETNDSKTHRLTGLGSRSSRVSPFVPVTKTNTKTNKDFERETHNRPLGFDRDLTVGISVYVTDPSPLSLPVFWWFSGHGVEN